MKLNEKIQIAEDLKDKFDRSKIVIVTDYKGLNVVTMNNLRRKLRDVGVDYQVAKNTLLRRAAEDNAVKPLQPEFKGPCGVAISYDDPVAPAKVLASFAKENDKFAIKAGVLGGKFVDGAGVQALASLPSREVLLGQLLSVMVGVPTSLVRALNGIPQKLLYALMAIKEQKEQAAPAVE